MIFSHVHIQRIESKDFDQLLQATSYSNMFIQTSSDMVAVSIHEKADEDGFMKVAILYNNLTALNSLMFYFGVHVARAEKKGGRG